MDEDEDFTFEMNQRRKEERQTLSKAIQEESQDSGINLFFLSTDDLPSIVSFKDDVTFAKRTETVKNITSTDQKLKSQEIEKKGTKPNDVAEDICSYFQAPRHNGKGIISENKIHSKGTAKRERIEDHNQVADIYITNHLDSIARKVSASPSSSRPGRTPTSLSPLTSSRAHTSEILSAPMQQETPPPTAIHTPTHARYQHLLQTQSPSPWQIFANEEKFDIEKFGIPDNDSTTPPIPLTIFLPLLALLALATTYQIGSPYEASLLRNHWEVALSRTQEFMKNTVLAITLNKEVDPVGVEIAAVVVKGVMNDMQVIGEAGVVDEWAGLELCARLGGLQKFLAWRVERRVPWEF